MLAPRHRAGLYGAFWRASDDLEAGSSNAPSSVPDILRISDLSPWQRPECSRSGRVTSALFRGSWPISAEGPRARLAVATSLIGLSRRGAAYAASVVCHWPACLALRQPLFIASTCLSANAPK